MAAPARARADYDYLIKLLLIGDSGLFSLFLSHFLHFVMWNCSYVFKSDDNLWLLYGICPVPSLANRLFDISELIYCRQWLFFFSGLCITMTHLILISDMISLCVCI